MKSKATKVSAAFKVKDRVELIEPEMRRVLLANLPKDASRGGRDPASQVTGTVTEVQPVNGAQGQFRIVFDSGRVFWLNAVDLKGVAK